jgi:hypothetical protein
MDVKTTRVSRDLGHFVLEPLKEPQRMSFVEWGHVRLPKDYWENMET